MEAFSEARAAGRVADAYTSAKLAKDSAPRAPSVREAIGLAAYDDGRWHESAQELLAHRRLAGAHANDAMIADCFRRLGEPHRALEFLAPLGIADVGTAIWCAAQIVRGDALADLGRTDTALAILESARRKAPPRARPVIDAALARLRA